MGMRFQGIDYAADGTEIVLFDCSWDEMAEANDPDVMAELAEIPVGETRTLGQCDHVRRTQ